ncbi:MAG: Fic family protein [Candidatus Daviesbacteria bacterium]|nr:Fic family protein [Candidatus Daviesbacteria bacterium]
MFKPVYNISPQILKNISEIAEIKAVIERSKVLPLNEAQLKRQAIVRMAHTSTSIEGNPLAEFQVDKVLAGMSINADDKSIQEVRNYQKVLQSIEQMSPSKKSISIEDILKLHGQMMTNLLEDKKTGHFRPGPIFVVDELGDGREKLRYEGPPAAKVAFLIQELVKWLAEADQEGIHPIIKAAIFHLQFVTIHPFSDGNGRMARLLTTFILYRDSWDFRRIIVLEDYYNRDRLGYYNALNVIQGNHYHEGEDSTFWIEYFVQGFLVEARKAAESIAQIGFGKVSDISEQVFLDKDEIKIMDFLSTTGRMTSNDVEDILNVAKRTSQLKLKGLVDKKLITLKGKGPSTYYILNS